MKVGLVGGDELCSSSSSSSEAIVCRILKQMVTLPYLVPVIDQNQKDVSCSTAPNIPNHSNAALMQNRHTM